MKPIVLLEGFEPDQLESKAKKLKFLQAVNRTSSVCPSSLGVLGYSNGVVRKSTKTYVKSHSEVLTVSILESITPFYENIETCLAAMFFAGHLARDADQEIRDSCFLWMIQNWIPQFDSWATVDHFCMDVLPFLTHSLNVEPFKSAIASLVKSPHVFRRRVGIVSFVKIVRKDKDSAVFGLKTIIALKKRTPKEDWYVEKAIPWILREISKMIPNEVQETVESGILNLSKTHIKESLAHIDRKRKNM